MFPIYFQIQSCLFTFILAHLSLICLCSYHITSSSTSLLSISTNFQDLLLAALCNLKFIYFIFSSPSALLIIFYQPDYGIPSLLFSISWQQFTHICTAVLHRLYRTTLSFFRRLYFSNIFSFFFFFAALIFGLDVILNIHYIKL